MTFEEGYKIAGQLADKLGRPIDEGIKRTVVGLWIHGIETSASCEGHITSSDPFPWVDIETSEPQDWKIKPKVLEGWKQANLKNREKLSNILREFNKSSSFPYPLKLIPRGIYGAVRLQTSRTKSIVDTLPPDHLSELREQMNQFGDFLVRDKN